MAALALAVMTISGSTFHPLLQYCLLVVYIFLFGL